ncbi:MAG: FAD-dependent oxidoreductase [Planctomycetes bacterium]|nr:FAD-dependent oxidoreductase [Planctomycetota bacterium]
MRSIVPAVIGLLLCRLAAPCWAEARVVSVDVCIYTATPSGILAAVAAKQAGRSVIIVEPGRWVGGMLGAGLKPMQDCPNFAATGGMTHDLLASLGQPHDDSPRRSTSQLNPRDIEADFAALLHQHGVEVIFDHRIASCDKRGPTIAAALFDRAPFDELGCPVAEPTERGDLRVTAKVFIDAGYEGDLMAAAGVSYRTGREAADAFDEPYAGVQPPMELAPIDPFVEPGRPDSGLLKWVENDHGKPLGAADEYTQAYNYRYYTTADPDHRIPISPPPNYAPADFELVGRYVAYLVQATDDPKKLHDQLVGICPGWRNSGEWNYQRSSLFSMAPVGVSQIYADANAAEKARIWKLHQNYLRGLFEFMRTDPRVPQSYRDELAQLGLDDRIHPDTHGWPHQLYIRVARRLKGRYTITAHDVYNKHSDIDDPIGLAQYGIDTYPARRIWIERDGQIFVGLEGKMFVGGNKGPTNVPYPIPYRAITPRADECTNLLVPVCFSATHLGYASARMEPVFMICGQSAGIAAAQAIAQNAAVQNIDMTQFESALQHAGQKLRWDGQRDRSTDDDAGDSALTFARLLGAADRDGDKRVSPEEWNADKPGWEWLFAVIDTDHNHRIDANEYDAFQKYKAAHPDWRKLRPAQ